MIYTLLIAAWPGFAQVRMLTLKDALALGMSDNQELKIARLDIERADQQKIISRSYLLPSVNLVGQVNHYFQLPAFFGFGEANGNDKVPYGRFGGKDQLMTAVTLYQPLYQPSAFPALRASNYALHQSKVSLSRSEVQVLSDIKQSYIRILVLRERIALQRESLTRNQKVLKDSRSLYLQGKALRVDTLRAYTAVRNLEPTLSKLEFDCETETLSLKTKLAISSDTMVDFADSLSVPDIYSLPTEAEVYREALTNNQGLTQLEIQKQIQEERVKSATALRMPTIGLTGQYQVQSQTDNFDYGSAYYPTSSFVGLQLSMPLFNGFATQAKVKRAMLERAQATEAKQQAVDELHAIVHDVMAKNHESRLRLETSLVVKETAQTSYNIILYRYQNGIASRLELTDAELTLSTAQSNSLEAVYDYLSARIELYQLMGKIE